MRRLRISILLASGLLAAAAAAAEGGPVPVTIAPGGTGGFEVAASSCPTFHWGAVGAAPRVELVVYRLSDAEAPKADSSSSRPELRVVLPGAARGWTPALDECLDAGGRYAWALRGVGSRAASDWSRPRLFEIARGPSPRELSAAFEVLMRLAGSQGSPPFERRDGGSLAEPAAAAVQAGAPSRPAGTAQASIPGTAIFSAEATAVSGESHGVTAVTHSAQGFALAAENVGGGPDLLLRGDVSSADAVVGEAFLDRPSASDQTFDFRNSLGGVMTLQVDGVDVVTEATDGDTLAALGCAPTQVAQWNGSSWQCASTGTDTLAGLACADNQVVHWSGTAWVCGQPTLTHHTCSNSGFPGDCTVNCPAGSSVWAGGCTSGGNDYLKINGPTGGASGPSGWRCQSGDLLGSSSSVTADLYCVAD